MITLNRTAIEKKFGNRGGIDTGARFAIAEAIMEGREWDRWLYDAAGRQTNDWEDDVVVSGVVIECVRSDRPETHWATNETAEVIAAMEKGVAKSFAMWSKHCGIHADDVRSESALDVGFDPKLLSARKSR